MTTGRSHDPLGSVLEFGKDSQVPGQRPERSQQPAPPKRWTTGLVQAPSVSALHLSTSWAGKPLKSGCLVSHVWGNAQERDCPGLDLERQMASTEQRNREPRCHGPEAWAIPPILLYLEKGVPWRFLIMEVTSGLLLSLLKEMDVRESMRLHFWSSRHLISASSEEVWQKQRDG